MRPIGNTKTSPLLRTLLKRRPLDLLCFLEYSALERRNPRPQSGLRSCRTFHLQILILGFRNGNTSVLKWAWIKGSDKRGSQCHEGNSNQEADTFLHCQSTVSNNQSLYL
ncbi:unnamed protein product, partial [Vitis vinifera]|uniref:Uncharacterized protein n=1 Tax=Vitis vinifera TaxID=29760 RepID=D7U218_VITVI